MKLRNLFYLLLALPLVFAACEPDNPDADKPVVKDPVLTLTSNATLEFTADGGAGEITYTLENAKEGVEVTAECAVEWVTNVTVAEKVTFNVEANEGEARETKVVVKYDTQKFEVAVKQAAKEAPEAVVFEAEKLTGYYKGNADVETLDNYVITFSDKGFAESGENLANATYYLVDIYAPLYQGEWSETMKVPAGEYTLGQGLNLEAWTFSNFFSCYVTTDDAAQPVVEEGFESGTLVVTEDQLTLKVVIKGVEHTVTYAGDYALKNRTEAPAQSIKMKYAYASYSGDSYSPGVADNFYFFLSNADMDNDGFWVAGAKYYRFDLYTEIVDKTEGLAIPYGTYEMDYTGSLAPGTINAEYSLYYSIDSWGDDYEDYLSFDDATVTVSANGIVADIVLEGVEYQLVFDGVVSIEDMIGGGDGGDDDESYSTLTSDVNFNIEGATFWIDDYGDYYYNGTNNYVVYVYEDLDNESGAYMMFDILTAGGATNIAGEYDCSMSEEAYTFFGGYYDSYWEEFYGAWYVDLDTFDMAPVVEGTIAFDIAADGTYTITFINCYDDADNAFTGTIKGRLYGDEGGSDEGGNDDVTTWAINSVDWGYISDSCNDIVLKTAPVNGEWNSFTFELLARVTDNKLPAETYTDENGGIILNYCKQYVDGNYSTMTEAEVVITNNADGTTTIAANWATEDSKNQATWTGMLPEYEL